MSVGESMLDVGETGEVMDVLLAHLASTVGAPLLAATSHRHGRPPDNHQPNIAGPRTALATSIQPPGVFALSRVSSQTSA